MSPQGFCRWQWSPRRADPVFLSALWFAFFFGLFITASDPAQGQPLFSPAQDPFAGSRVFGSKGCSQCHSIGGIGNHVGPDLGRTPGVRSFYDLAAAMWNHFPQMANQMERAGISHPQLSARETGDLIAFLYTLNYFDRPGDAKRGNELFAKKYCISCHQLAGTGGVVGPNLDGLAQYGSPIFVSAAMWNHGPAMAEAMAKRDIKRPTFTASELEDLIAYIKSAKPDLIPERLYILPGSADHGQELFSQRRCLQCHSVKGRGGKVGGELAERKTQISLVQFAAAMWNKAPAMLREMKDRNVPVPHLRPDEMADIVAYLYSVQYFARPGDFHRGQTLAASKNCLTCHAIEGKGGKTGPDFKNMRLDQPAMIVAAMWNHASTMKQKMSEKSLEWPQLSGKEMADVITFIQLSTRSLAAPVKR